MTPVRFKRENHYSVSVFDDTDDGANRGGFSGPKEVIDGIMDMQEEARLYRKSRILKAAGIKDAVAKAGGVTDISVKALEDLDAAYQHAVDDRAAAMDNEYLRGYYNGIALAHAIIYDHDADFVLARVKGTGTDRGAGAALMDAIAKVEAEASGTPLGAVNTITVNLNSWDDTVSIVKAAHDVFKKLSGVVGFPELHELGEAIKRANDRALGVVEDERDALDRVNDELAAEEAPTAGPENSVSIEELPYPELVMLLQSEQITVARYVEEMNRREKVWAEQAQADADMHRAHMRRRFTFWFF